jgi:hypothetical protein
MQEAVENVIIDKKKEEKNTTAYLLMYQIHRPLGLVFVIYFWWLGDLLPLYI